MSFSLSFFFKKKNTKHLLQVKLTLSQQKCTPSGMMNLIICKMLLLLYLNLDLMEDVGQISYVFADKTGTLTENEMVFKYCNIGTTCLSVFGYYEGLRISEGPSDSETFNTKAAAERSHPSNRNVSNKCVSSKEELQYCHEVKTFLKQPEAKAFFECLAICHTVTVEYEGELSSHNEVHRKRKLAAASPDEEALVLATEIPEVCS